MLAGVAAFAAISVIPAGPPQQASAPPVSEERPTVAPAISKSPVRIPTLSQSASDDAPATDDAQAADVPWASETSPGQPSSSWRQQSAPQQSSPVTSPPAQAPATQPSEPATPVVTPSQPADPPSDPVEPPILVDPEEPTDPVDPGDSDDSDDQGGILCDLPLIDLCSP